MSRVCILQSRPLMSSRKRPKPLSGGFLKSQSTIIYAENNLLPLPGTFSPLGTIGIVPGAMTLLEAQGNVLISLKIRF